IPSVPGVLGEAAELAVQALGDDFMGVHAHLERHRHLLPAQTYHGGIARDVIDLVGQGFFRFRGPRLDGYAQSVFRLVIGEAAPAGGVAGEDYSPLILVRDHVQAVNSPGQGLAFDGHRVSELDGGVFIRAGPPNLAVGDDSAPDLPAFDQRTVIVDGDISDADSLRDSGVLAVSWQVHQG